MCERVECARPLRRPPRASDQDRRQHHRRFPQQNQFGSHPRERQRPTAELSFSLLPPPSASPPRFRPRANGRTDGRGRKRADPDGRKCGQGLGLGERPRRLAPRPSLLNGVLRHVILGAAEGGGRRERGGQCPPTVASKPRWQYQSHSTVGGRPGVMYGHGMGPSS